MRVLTAGLSNGSISDASQVGAVCFLLACFFVGFAVHYWQQGNILAKVFGGWWMLIGLLCLVGSAVSTGDSLRLYAAENQALSLQAVFIVCVLVGAGIDLVAVHFMTPANSQRLPKLIPIAIALCIGTYTLWIGIIALGIVTLAGLGKL